MGSNPPPLPRFSVKHFQELGWRNDRSAPEWVQRQQIFISTYNHLRLSGNCSLQHHIIFGVAADLNPLHRSNLSPSQDEQRDDRADIFRGDMVLVANSGSIDDVNELGRERF